MASTVVEAWVKKATSTKRRAQSQENDGSRGVFSEVSIFGIHVTILQELSTRVEC